MPLSCSCDNEESDWYYESPKDYRTYPVSARRKKCSSCGERIKGGAELGYDCVGPWEDMRELAEEYGETHARV